MGQTREIDKRHDLNVEVLEYAANRAAGIDGKLETWTGTPIGAGAGNFVTDGVYRVKGTSKAGAGTVSWSMVVKRLRPDPDRDDPAHYNYWKREALVYSSGLLERLPGELHTPVCYAVENKPDGSLWLWLEDIGEHTQPVWQKEDYAFAAAELGRFQAAFCPGEPLPVEPWLNRAWLRSWINECRKYQPRPSLASAEIRGKDKRLERIVEQFERVNHQMDNWLQAVERLPRTMAHQDSYESNLMITRDAAGQARLTVIDWQFASLSGIGEDLGRFYGLTMSRGSAPIECLDEYRELFIGSYNRRNASIGLEWGRARHPPGLQHFLRGTLCLGGPEASEEGHGGGQQAGGGTICGFCGRSVIGEACPSHGDPDGNGRRNG